jgi:hypothetical protein
MIPQVILNIIQIPVIHGIVDEREQGLRRFRNLLFAGEDQKTKEGGIQNCFHKEC